MREQPNTVVQDDEISVQCDGGCERWHHKECTGMTTGEFDILKRKNCKLLWFCDRCKHEVSKKKEEDKKTESLSEKVDTIMDFLKNQLGRTIEEKIKESINTESTIVKQRDITTKKKNEIRESNTEEGGTNEHTQQNRNEEQKTERNNVNEDEEGRMNPQLWTQVVNRGRRNHQTIRQPVVIGRKQDEELQAGNKTAWIYIGKLKHNTSTDTVVRFLKRNGIEGDIICESLNARGTNKSFKVGVPYSYIDNMVNPEFWPTGVIVRRFRFRRGQPREDQEEGGFFE